MMKLYFSPGACCMSCHIALEETKTPFELVYVGKKVDEAVRNKFLKLNPAGAVPTLELDNGKVLTQNIAILEYIADQHPEAGLLEKPGTEERAEIMRWLSFVASDLHKSFSPIFNINSISTDKNVQKDVKNWIFKNIDKYLTILDTHLKNKTYLASDRFTIADAYLYTVYQWTHGISFPTDKFDALNRYSDNISKRPSVVAVHKREEPFKN